MESWPHKDNLGNVVFPSSIGFLPRTQLEWKTPVTKGGWVFILVSQRLIVTEQANLTTNCELVWAKMQFVVGKTIAYNSLLSPIRTLLGKFRGTWKIPSPHWSVKITCTYGSLETSTVFFFSERYYNSPWNKIKFLRFSTSDSLIYVLLKTNPILDKLPKYIMQYLVKALDNK